MLPLDDVESARDRPRRPPRRARRPPAGARSTPSPRPKPIARVGAGASRPPPTRSPRPRQRDAWQRAELERILDDVVAEAAGARRRRSTLLEVRALLAERLRGRPTRANFRTGHLTICTLVPMRSVPHRVVCLLGLDDGAFPRKAPRDGDDLMLADPHVGDRDPRTEDRQLLLDALMAATRPPDRHLHRQRRAHERAAPARRAGRRAARRRRAHGRATRARRCSSATRCSRSTRATSRRRAGRRRAWSFDRVTLDGARALDAAARRAARRSWPRPLPPRRRAVLELDDLVALRPAPGARVPAPAPRLSVGDYADEVDGRPAGRARRPREVAGRPAAARRAARRRRRPTPRSRPRSRRGDAAARRARPTRCSRSCCPSVEEIVAPGRGARSRSRRRSRSTSGRRSPTAGGSAARSRRPRRRCCAASPTRA